MSRQAGLSTQRLIDGIRDFPIRHTSTAWRRVLAKGRRHFCRRYAGPDTDVCRAQQARVVPVPARARE
jgi:hypothetical protein